MSAIKMRAPMLERVDGTGRWHRVAIDTKRGRYVNVGFKAMAAGCRWAYKEGYGTEDDANPSPPLAPEAWEWCHYDRDIYVFVPVGVVLYVHAFDAMLLVE